MLTVQSGGRHFRKGGQQGSGKSLAGVLPAVAGSQEGGSPKADALNDSGPRHGWNQASPQQRRLATTAAPQYQAKCCPLRCLAYEKFT